VGSGAEAALFGGCAGGAADVSAALVALGRPGSLAALGMTELFLMTESFWTTD